MIALSMISTDAAKGVIQVTKTNTKPAADATETEVEAVTEEIKFSAKDLAAECGVDAKAFRRWLRSVTDRRANKGGRWAFTAEERTATLAAWAERNAPAEDEAADQPEEG